MFLQVMDNEEKEKFLEFVYKVANADGEYAEEEKEIVNSYMKELSIDTIKDTLDVECKAANCRRRETHIKIGDALMMTALPI